MNDHNNPEIRRALLSVTDKTGIVELATALQQLGIDIISTGGTAQLLKEHKIPLTPVSEYTGFPEIMDGRVKTLHPKIYGGILARTNLDNDVLKQQHIAEIDLVIVNLYAFQNTIATPDCSLADAIAHIDIGGPAMIRAAAKNHQRVTVVVDPHDYNALIATLKQYKATALSQRYALAAKAFAYTAAYDTAIADYFANPSQPSPTRGEGAEKVFPEIYTSHYYKKQTLRYGENPHQQAALYIEQNPPAGTIISANQLQGKELSYNNIADAEAALECVKSLSQHACAIVKHANPCGIAVRDTQLAAYQHAFLTDPTSSFGGIIAFNQKLDEHTATAIIQQQFVEVIIAPQVSQSARDVFAKKPNIRILECGFWSQDVALQYDYKKITGGLLIQTCDNLPLDTRAFKIVSNCQPTEAQMHDLIFAWQVVKHVKSNAIVYAKNQATIGIGAGQMSRVMSAQIASLKAQAANLSIKDAVMASDAFFPFRDGIDTAAQQGISAIIAPGGSVKDPEVIQAANDANIALIFTDTRHFRH